MQALCDITGNDKHRGAVLSAGAMGALLQLLEHDSTELRVKESAIQVLHIIAETASAQSHGVITDGVDQTRHSKHQVVHWSAGGGERASSSRESPQHSPDCLSHWDPELGYH